MRLRGPSLCCCCCSLCSAYSPRVSAVKEAAPRISFSRSSRFGGPFGSYQVLNNSATSGAVSALQPNLDATSAQSPRFSFGPPRAANGAADEQFVRHKPRTSFMTHSIRSGSVTHDATQFSGRGSEARG